MNSVNDPLEKSGACSLGVTSVFRLHLARLRSRLSRIRGPGKVTGPHRTPRNGRKTHPPGKWHARYRKSTPVPRSRYLAVDHPPC